MEALLPVSEAIGDLAVARPLGFELPGRLVPCDARAGSLESVPTGGIVGAIDAG